MSPGELLVASASAGIVLGLSLALFSLVTRLLEGR